MWILLGYHLFLIATNQTTNEYLKKYRKNHPQNPFASSLAKNLKKFCTSRRKKGHFGHSVYHEKPASYSNVVTNTIGTIVVGTHEHMSKEHSPDKAFKSRSYE